MSKGDNTPGISRLAGVIREIASGEVPRDLILDFGEIRPDGSLLTNTLTVAIPKGDYMALRGLNVQTGSRVLVGWVQNDAVIIGILGG